MRGLHFQYHPAAQLKLVRCGKGKFLDVVVDIRRGSPTIGDWLSETLSFDNGKQLFVPEKFLHSFVTLTNETEIIYKCSNFYNLKLEGFVTFNDPDININWGCEEKDMSLSSKDRKSVLLRVIESPFYFEG